MQLPSSRVATNATGGGEIHLDRALAGGESAAGERSTSARPHVPNPTFLRATDIDGARHDVRASNAAAPRCPRRVPHLHLAV